MYQKRLKERKIYCQALLLVKILQRYFADWFGYEPDEVCTW